MKPTLCRSSVVAGKGSFHDQEEAPNDLSQAGKGFYLLVTAHSGIPAGKDLASKAVSARLDQ